MGDSELRKVFQRIDSLEDENERIVAEIVYRSLISARTPKDVTYLFSEVDQRGRNLSQKWRSFENHEKNLYFREALEALIGMDIIIRREDELYELVNP